jgi:serine/threonine protein kinase
MNASFDMTLLQKQEPREEETVLHLTSAASWDELSTAASKKRSCRVSHDALPSNSKLPATPASVARRRHLSSSSEEPHVATSSKGRRQSKRSFGTCTTATSTVLGADDHSMHSMHTVDSSASTQGGGDAKNFRFTSFPASLPRIPSHPKPSLAPFSSAKWHKPLLPSSSLQYCNDSHNTSLSSWNHTAEYIGYSDEEEEEEQDVSPLQHSAFSYQLSTPRARLNFNHVTLFPSAADDTRDPLEEHLLLLEQQGADHLLTTKKLPFRPTTHRHLHRTSTEWGHDDFHQMPTPSRDVESTDQDLQLPCSPIPDIPEEETCTGDSTGTASSSSPSYSTRTSRCHRYAASTPLTLSSSGAAGPHLRPPSRRPLPDRHAFDDGGAATVLDGWSSSSISSATTHASSDVLPTTAPPLSPKLLCPPTPVRVHPMFREATEKTNAPALHTLHHTKLARSNSLITNKLLATCSPQLLSTWRCRRSSSSPDHRSTPAELWLPLDVATTEANTSHPTLNALVEPSPLGGPPRSEAPSVPVTVSSRPPVVSLARNFEVRSTLGSGAFADVYKVVSRQDGRRYAIKRHRRQFRSKRDREAALSEVRSMQRIQSHMCDQAAPDPAANGGVYLLFFYQAWQEDGHILCQTELCCRDTCREMIDTIQSWNTVTSLKFPTIASSSAIWFPPPAAAASPSMLGRVVPESVIWKICHDISAGLAFIHSQKVALVHNDIKPSNILLVPHPQYGALCKIGDFGMARDIGTSEDGQEGDQKYMTLEVLQSGTSYTSADIFSLGLTLYEMASHARVTIPSDGPRWHELRSGVIHAGDYPADRSLELIQLIRAMMDPNSNARPSANAILSLRTVVDAGTAYHPFLRDYIHDVERQEQQEEQWANHWNEEQTPQNAMSRPLVCSPPLHQIPQLPFGVLRSPNEAALASS